MNETIDETELLLQGENILDRKMEEQKRIENVINLLKDVQSTMNSIQ